MDNGKKANTEKGRSKVGTIGSNGKKGTGSDGYAESGEDTTDKDRKIFFEDWRYFMYFLIFIQYFH